MKKRGIITICCIAVLVLALAFFLPDMLRKAPEIPAEPQPDAVTEIAEPSAEPSVKPEPEKAQPEPEKSEEPEPEPEVEIVPAIEPEPVPESEPVAATEPAAPETTPEPEAQLTCTFGISCQTVLSMTDSFNADKLYLVPESGWLFYDTVQFSEGETVFDVLKRITQDGGIHMEFSTVVLTGSAYIEGIGNIYEFDGGALSGWMYSVNGSFPNYGCSSAVLSDGDNVQWVYTFDLGRDVGAGEFSAWQGQAA